MLANMLHKDQVVKDTVYLKLLCFNKGFLIFTSPTEKGMRLINSVCNHIPAISIEILKTRNGFNISACITHRLLQHACKHNP